MAICDQKSAVVVWKSSRAELWFIQKLCVLQQIFPAIMIYTRQCDPTLTIFQFAQQFPSLNVSRRIFKNMHSLRISKYLFYIYYYILTVIFLSGNKFNEKIFFVLFFVLDALKRVFKKWLMRKVFAWLKFIQLHFLPSKMLSRCYFTTK